MSNPNPSYKIPKGTTPNPNGRPKREWTVAGLIEEAMEAEAETGVPYKKAVYTKLVEMARAGDIMAIKEVNQRLDGMPQQAIDHTTKGKELPNPVFNVLTLEAKDNLEKLYEGSDSSNK